LIAHGTSGAGNLYGVTLFGGNPGCFDGFGCGTAFRLAPNQDGTWTESTLYAFKGGNDGGNAWTNLTFDGAGNLYGTTVGDGTTTFGSVFEITP
jgi:uncharacterized repeat protein (TIGR03803 family)